MLHECHYKLLCLACQNLHADTLCPGEQGQPVVSTPPHLSTGTLPNGTDRMKARPGCCHGNRVAKLRSEERYIYAVNEESEDLTAYPVEGFVQ